MIMNMRVSISETRTWSWSKQVRQIHLETGFKKWKGRMKRIKRKLCILTEICFIFSKGLGQRYLFYSF